MNTGTYISGGGHVALLVWLLLGGVFAPDREVTLPDTVDVAIISAEEFAALTRPQVQPDATTDAPEIQAPDVDIAALPDTEPDTPPLQDSPSPTPTEPVIDDVPPEQTPPDPVLPEPELAVPDDDPAPNDATRVAPDPVIDPPDTPEIAETETPPVSDDPSTDAVPEDQPEAAPEEATTEIVTEADEPTSAAPTTSSRPVARPQRVAEAEPEADPEPIETAEPDAQPQADPLADAVAAAVADAVETPPGAEVAAPSGPPLSRGEKDGLRVAVQQCWNTGSLSSAALQVTVVVAVSMARDGTPDVGSIRMVDFSGGADSAAQQAFEAARRAIIRCGRTGYDLPVEKYTQWQEIEMTFNPERMRIK